MIRDMEDSCLLYRELDGYLLSINDIEKHSRFLGLSSFFKCDRLENG